MSAGLHTILFFVVVVVVGTLTDHLLGLSFHIGEWKAATLLAAFVCITTFPATSIGFRSQRYGKTHSISV